MPRFSDKCLKICEYIFEILLCEKNILDLLFAGDFTFNNNVSVKSDIVKSSNERLEVYLTVADLLFCAELAAVGGVNAILAVKLHNVFTENVQRVNGICFTVHYKVCGVKVDTEIARADSFDGTKKSDGSFLTGFKEKLLTVCEAVFRNFFDSGNYVGEIAVCEVPKDDVYSKYYEYSCSNTGLAVTGSNTAMMESVSSMPYFAKSEPTLRS